MFCVISQYKTTRKVLRDIKFRKIDKFVFIRSRNWIFKQFSQNDSFIYLWCECCNCQNNRKFCWQWSVLCVCTVLLCSYTFTQQNTTSGNITNTVHPFMFRPIKRGHHNGDFSPKHNTACEIPQNVYITKSFSTFACLLQ